MSWDDEAAGWDDDPAVRTYAGAAFRSLNETLASRDVPWAGARVLDFGCGTGLLTAAMAEHAREVIGLDASAAMIDVLRAKAVPNVRAVAGDLEALELGAFDLITCSSVCAFLTDYPATVAALVGRLVPGGLFVQWDWELDPDAEEPFGLSHDTIRQALLDAGLQHVVVDVGFEASFQGQTMAPLRGVGRKPSPGA